MSEKSVNFKALIQQMQRAGQDGVERPTILGGQFSPERLDAFLAAWRGRWDAMPWKVWEHISHIEIEFAGESRDSEYLQRAEIFGEGGHLSLRRDGNRWLWHYIGPKGQPAPKGFDEKSECEDFWESNAGADLRCYDERVLLWGEEVVRDKQSAGFWWEDRVAAASLHYPNALQGMSRVYLHFNRYTEAGQTVFVRYRRLGNEAEVKS